MDIKNKRRQLIGTVYSDKMDKTIVVKVIEKEPHPIYRKYINKSKNIILKIPRICVQRVMLW